MLANFFRFSGRLNRQPYWLMTLALVVGMIVLALIISGLMGSFGESGVGIGVVIIGLLYIAVIVSSLSIAVRRLHDRNKSGWWLLIFYILPGVIQGIGAASGVDVFSAITSLIGFGISIWALVELGFLKGTNGPNDFGPDPLTGASVNPEVF